MQNLGGGVKSPDEEPDLSNLEERLLAHINELMNQLANKFADKNATLKAIKYIENKIKNILDLLNKDKQQDDCDDGMFSKKHLCGLTCACCEKDLVNIQGKQY